MSVLGFFTSGPACELAILPESGAPHVLNRPMARGQDVRLPELTQQILQEAGLKLQDIDRLAVVTGPGSFTGIRIGVAFARGLALALDKPCVGVTSLEASLPAGQQGSALVLLPAQTRPPKLTYWTQSFRSGVATGAPIEQSVTEIASHLDIYPHMLFGSGLDGAEAFARFTQHPVQPSALRAVECAAQFDPADHPPLPVYARAPDAQPAKPVRG